LKPLIGLVRDDERFYFPLVSPFMNRIPSDRFPADRQSSMPPPSQPSFRSSDEPDPLKISFLKGPKRKRLAKVRIRLLPSFLAPFIDVFYPLNRPVMLATRANGDATARVSSTFLLCSTMLQF
jgi:hypothetical protein